MKKGFTIIELLTAFVIMSLIAGIGLIVYNGFIEKSENDYYHSIESSLLLSGNSYFQDNRSELPVNNYNSVQVSKLIEQNYIEPIKDKNGNLCSEGNVFIYEENGKYNYEACIKCGDYESEGKYCGYDTGEKNIAYPTTALCKFKSNLIYTGNELQLTKVLETSAYTLSPTKGINAGEYTITATLKSGHGYFWNDEAHSTSPKTFKCSIEKATPKVTIPSSIEVIKGGTETFTEEAKVKGTFENVSDDITIVTVSPKTNSDVDAEIEKTETVTGVEGGTTKIEVTFTPDSPNYKPVTKTIDVTVTKGIPIPTTSAYCKDLTYNGTEQVLTNAPDGEFVFSDNKGTDAKSYIVKANLTGSKTWEDGTTTEQTITCTIKKASIAIPQSPEDKVYTGTNQNHGVIVPSKTSIVSGSDIQGTIVKDYKVTIKLDDSNNYEWSDKTISNKEVTWKIVKSDTTTTINAIEKTYNGENQGASGASSKLNSNNQSIPGATYSYKYYTNSGCTSGETTTSPKTARQYYVVATLNGTSNYNGSSSSCTSYKMNKYVPTITLSSTGGSVTIDKTVSFNEKADVKGKFTNTILSSTIGTVSPVNTSSINANTNVSVTLTGKTVGTTTVTITFTPDDTTNYASISSTSAGKKVYNLEVINGISKPTASIYCKDLTYDGTTQTLTNTAGSGYSFSGNTGKNAGEYTVYANLNSGKVWSDGTTNQASIVCEIKKREVVVKADNKTMTYGNSLPTFTSTQTGVVSGETGVISNVTYDIYNSSGTKITLSSLTNVGTYEIRPKATTSNTNYTVSEVKGSLSIGTRNITVKARNESESGGGTLTASNTCDLVSGTLASVGHIIECTCSGTQTGVGSSVKTLNTVTIKVSGKTTTATSNYNITKQNGTLTVEEKPLATCPTTNNYSGTYDGNSHTITSTGGSGGTVKYSEDNITWQESKPTLTYAGTKTIYVKVFGDSEHADATCTTRTITISKRSITVRATDQITYNSITADNTCVLVSGSLASGDSITCSCSGSRTSPGTTTKTLDSVTIKHSSTDVTDSYEVTKQNGTLEACNSSTYHISGNSCVKDVVCTSPWVVDTSTYESCLCPTGYHIDSLGDCVEDIVCTGHSHLNSSGTGCVCDTNYYGTNCDTYCAGTGKVWNGSSCVCGTGYHASGSSCVADAVCTGHSHQNTNKDGCVCDTNYYGTNCDTYCAGTGKVWNGSSCVCGTGYHASGSSCVADAVCTGHSHLNSSGTGCVCDTNYYGTNCDTYCAGTGKVWNGSSCVCGTGYHASGSSCVADAVCTGHSHQNTNKDGCVCDTNYYGTNCDTYCAGTGKVWNGSSCVCSTGYHASGSSCVADATCTSPWVLNSSKDGCNCPSPYYEMNDGSCGSCPNDTTYNSSTKTCDTNCTWSNGKVRNGWGSWNSMAECETHLPADTATNRYVCGQWYSYWKGEGTLDCPKIGASIETGFSNSGSASAYNPNYCDTQRQYYATRSCPAGIEGDCTCTVTSCSSGIYHEYAIIEYTCS